MIVDETDRLLREALRKNETSLLRVRVRNNNKARDSILNKIGDGVDLGNVSNPIMYSRFSRGLSKVEQSTLIHMISNGELGIYSELDSNKNPTYILKRKG